jgi:hypothetical protein
MTTRQVVTDWPVMRGSEEMSREDAVRACAWLVVSEATSREEATGKPADIAQVAREMNEAGFPDIFQAESAGDSDILAGLQPDVLDEVIARAREREENEGTGDWT